MKLRRTSVVVVTAAAAWAVPGAALAVSGLPVTIDCGSAVFETVVHNGRWAPANVVGTHQVLLPVAFGEETVTFTPPEGEPVVEVLEPRTRGTGRAPAGATLYEDCTYEVHLTEEDGSTVHVVGTVDAALVGRPG